MLKINKKLVYILLASSVMFLAAFFASCAKEGGGAGSGAAENGGAEDGDATSSLQKTTAIEKAANRQPNFKLTLADNRFSFIDNTLANIATSAISATKTIPAVPAVLTVVPKDDTNINAVYNVMSKITFTTSEANSLATVVSSAAEDDVLYEVSRLLMTPSSEEITLVPLTSLSTTAPGAKELKIMCSAPSAFGVSITDSTPNSAITTIAITGTVITATNTINCAYIGPTIYTEVTDINDLVIGKVLVENGTTTQITEIKKAITANTFNFYVEEFENEAAQTAALAELTEKIIAAKTATKILDELNAYMEKTYVVKTAITVTAGLY